MKKILSLTLSCILVLSSSILSFASGNLEKSDDTSNKGLVYSAISSIEDRSIKEKIQDIYSVSYLVVKVAEDVADIPTVTSEEVSVNKINKLSQMDEKELDKLVRQELKKIIDTVDNNQNALLLPSSANVFKKYNYSTDFNRLIDAKKNVHLSSEALATRAIVDRNWSKTAYGELRGGFDVVNATYHINVDWAVRDAKILAYSEDEGGGYNKVVYMFNGSKILISEVPAYYQLQRGHIKGQAKYEKIGVTWHPVDYITLDIWFYNDGGFDVSVTN